MMLAFLALLPIIIVSILMVAFMWPSKYAMPVGWGVAVILAMTGWRMSFQWVAAASIAALINAADILIIVFGALVILQLMTRSGGMTTISRSMAHVSADHRIQVLIIGWLLVCFLEAAAGFGTPAAIAAPLLIGLGIPPLVAAVLTLMADTVPVTFGAVGVPIWGGFAAIRTATQWPAEISGTLISFQGFLAQIGSIAAIIQMAIGTFIPVVLMGFLTKMTTGSFLPGLRIWPLALLAGACFTVPQMVFAVLLGPELPALLGSLSGLVLFVIIVRLKIFVPRENWHAGQGDDAARVSDISPVMPASQGTETELGVLRAWSPYILIGAILLVGRIPMFGMTPLLRSWSVGWSEILGTPIGRQITVLYNPGVVPFLLIALLIPWLHHLSWKHAAASWKKALRMVAPAAIALFFTLSMVYTMIHSGDAAGVDSMLLVMAKAAARYAGDAWYMVAPFVGILGSFVSGSNTVSNIMFGPFQFDTARAASLSPTLTLALQAVGGAAGNMVCVHNVVAVLTTVGLLGKEGRVIRQNIPVCLGYGLLAGAVGWALVLVAKI